jgi:DUF917 family protein
MKHVLSTKEDIQDFVKGVTFFGTGGGGRPEDGLKHLLDCMDEGFEISFTEICQIPDDVWCCSVFGMGSIAPGADGGPAPYNIVKRNISQPMVESIKKLEEHAGVKIDVVVPFELGGSNTPKAMAAGIRLGAIIPDGDYCGRAVPEMGQTTVAIEGMDITPIAICDDWGNVMVIQAVATIDAAEAIGKMVSTVTKAPDVKATCAHAAFLMKAGDMKRVIVPGTLSKSLMVGRAIRRARLLEKDPVEEIVKVTGGIVLFKGRVTSNDWQSKDGYMTGTYSIMGDNEYTGDRLDVWYKNENHLAKLNDKAVAMSPDMIHVVMQGTGEPVTNTNMAKGLEVVVTATPNPLYRTTEAIDALGPKHFGFDIQYVPI